MFRNPKMWSALVVLGLLVGLAASCAAPQPPAPAGVDFVFAQGADATKLDPTDVTDGESIRVTTQIYNGLVRFKPGETLVEPDLATDWTASDDGLVWDFNLRQDVKFHDGTPFNAEAVVYNMMRQ
ncbi:MAG TPA: ABC transporter substrate-binding protein, partial [Anaerolineae bacterium]|nr:ABC transporter substrate-binding protein [Anaerolineae bacterium]